MRERLLEVLVQIYEITRTVEVVRWTSWIGGRGSLFSTAGSRPPNFFGGIHETTGRPGILPCLTRFYLF